MAAKPFYADYVNRLMRWYCRAMEEGKEVNLENSLDRRIGTLWRRWWSVE